MAINYASKYASQIDERFSKEALSGAAVNNDYDFVGVKTINVYSVPTAPMNDYSRTGASRYGTPAELENSVQEMTMTQDRSFTFSIDRGNFNDTQMSNAAGQALQRQLREVVIPEIDKYRFATICANAGTTGAAEVTSENAYSVFLDATEALTDNLVPTAGAVAYVSSTYYKLIKQDDAFVKQGDAAQAITLRGQVGTIDGIPVVVVPKSYLPTNVLFVVTNRIATAAPVKLAEYKIHDNPPGINGWLVEGRVYHDAFVLDNKKKAIYVHTIPIGTLTVTSAAGTASGDSKITVTETAGTGNGFVYKVGTAAETVVYGQSLTTGWTALTSGTDITAATGKKITVAEVDANGKAVKVGSATVTAKA